jgi:phage gp29-like protein
LPPRAKSFNELPAVTFSDWDNLARVKGALQELETGNFAQASDLVDAMSRDDRIEGVISARLDALHGLEMSFDPPAGEEDNDRAQEVAEEASREWTRWFPEDALRDLRWWGLWLNAGVAQVVWQRGEKWRPTLQVWHPRHLRWNEVDKRYEIQSMEGIIPVETGTGQWVLYTPYGRRRGWMRGFVRSLAVPWLIRQWGLRDWAGHSEAHGTPIKKAKVPHGKMSTAEAKKFFREVALLAKRGTVLVEQGEDSPTRKTAGWDVELLEAKEDGHKVFKELLNYADTAIAVRVKGSNLTTEVQGGSRAASETHREVDNDKLRFDAQTTSTTLHDQVIEPWAEFNHERALAPWPHWDTNPPEDQKARADALDKLADALKKLGDAAVPVDATKLAEDFGIPLRELTDEERALLGAPSIFQYHIENGIPTVNEVRARLRLPPREGGDEPVAPAKPATPEPPEDDEDDDVDPPPRRGKAAKPDAVDAFLRAVTSAVTARAASELPPGAIEGQRYADDLADAGTVRGSDDLAPDLAEILRVVRETPAKDGAPDGAELKRRLVEAFKGMDTARLAETVRRGMVLAQLNGRMAVVEDL